MKAIMLPRAPLCGDCGAVLYVLYPTVKPARAIVHCAMSSCPEYNRRYQLDLEVIELKPAPDIEYP